MSDTDDNWSETGKRRGDYGIFQKSKKIQRSPTGTKVEGDTNIVEICKQTLEELKLLRRDQNGVRDKLETTNKEIIALRQEIKATNEKWEQKYKEMENKLKVLEVKVDHLEREKRKNNVVVTGIQMEEETEEPHKQIQEWMNKELEINCIVKETKKIAQNKVLVTMEHFEEKIKVLKNKNKLKGKTVYIDSDLTQRERNTQWKLRMEARKIRGTGKNVKLGHLALMVNGKWMIWNEEENKLEERKSKN